MLFETFTIHTALDIYGLIVLGFIIYLGVRYDLFLDIKKSDNKVEEKKWDLMYY